MELWQLQQMRALPLEAKIVKTQLRIREWYEHWDGNVYVSFSGGKDSTVLLHIARGLYPEIPAVFSDTGLEFPEIREFVRAMPNVTWVRPGMSFRKVIEKHGYPVISKEQAQWIERARKGKPKVIKEKLYGVRADGTATRFCTSAAWRHLINAPFKISAECCNEMKKKPLKRYAKESGRIPIIGTMAAESKLREKNWLKTGCNAYDAKRPVSTPLSFWT
ncbi:MAG: phosphoadenosine phosphosulfate reductase family protein, partial [Christensenellales bacterium]